MTRPPPSRNDASDASERADAVGTIPGRLAALLNLLETVGAVRSRRNVEPVEGGPSPEEAAEHHRSVERSRLEMMRRYAELTDCRRRFLLRYFDEVFDEPCGRARVCSRTQCGA